MNTKTLLLSIVLLLVVASCQPAVTTPVPTSTPQGQVETQVAATLSVGETSTAAAENANQTSTAAARISPFNAALTADVMTAAARTPVPWNI